MIKYTFRIGDISKLARECGVSRNAIWKIRHRLSIPSLELAKKLEIHFEKVFGIEITRDTWLYPGEYPNNPFIVKKRKEGKKPNRQPLNFKL